MDIISKGFVSHTPILVLCYHACMNYDCSDLGCRFFLVTLMLVHYLLRKYAYRDIQLIFESTQNKQQYGTKITCTGKGGEIMVSLKLD